MSDFKGCNPIGNLSVKNGLVWDSCINGSLGYLFYNDAVGAESWMFDPDDGYYLTAEDLEAVAKWLRILNGRL